MLPSLVYSTLFSYVIIDIIKVYYIRFGKEVSAVRTSRVTGSAVRSYGSMRKPVDSSASFSLMGDGSGLDQFAHQYEQKQKKKKQQQTFNGNISSNKSHKLMKGMFFNPDRVMQMRNDMIRTSMVVNYLSHNKSRHRTYRESI